MTRGEVGGSVEASQRKENLKILGGSQRKEAEQLLTPKKSRKDRASGRKHPKGGKDRNRRSNHLLSSYPNHSLGKRVKLSRPRRNPKKKGKNGKPTKIMGEPHGDSKKP